MYKYKNVSENEQTLIGVGLVKPGEEVETSVLVENSSFELVSETAAAQPNMVVGTAPQAQPTAVSQATPVEPAKETQENKEGN